MNVCSRLYFVPLFLIITILHGFCQVSWEQKADFGGNPRMLASGFSIGAPVNKGYIGTGMDGTNFYMDFWEFDPVTGTWAQVAGFGGGMRQGGVGFSIGTKGYIGTGRDETGSYYKDFWEFDPGNNQWTQKAPFGGIERVEAVGFSINNKGYIGVGTTGFTNNIDFWQYDPNTDQWIQKANFDGVPRQRATGFFIGNKGYVGTGYDDSGNLTNDFWEYNPSNDTWTERSLFPGTPRRNATGFSIKNKGYLGLGYDGSYKKDFWVYDQTSDIWTQIDDFSGSGRTWAISFAIGDTGYLGTGSSGTYKNDFWSFYDSLNTTISEAMDLNQGMKIHYQFIDENLIIRFDSPSIGKFSLQILNSEGKILYQEEGIELFYKQILKRNFTSLNDGIYFLRMCDETGIRTLKILCY